MTKYDRYTIAMAALEIALVGLLILAVCQLAGCTKSSKQKHGPYYRTGEPMSEFDYRELDGTLCRTTKLAPDGTHGIEFNCRH